MDFCGGREDVKVHSSSVLFLAAGAFAAAAGPKTSRREALLLVGGAG